jgi:hypothetical protein
MRLKFFVFLALLLTTIVFSIIPAMAQVNPPPQNDDPVTLTQELRNVVNSINPEIFKGYAITRTDQVINALINKIDVVIVMFEKGNFKGGCVKLRGDIAPKLNFCETVRVRALSWLSADILDEPMVYEFADTCQGFIDSIIELADPRPTP